MAQYVSDTHALAWYLAGSPLISDPARNAFDGAVNGTDEVIIPVIVIAELTMMVEKQRIPLNLNQVVATLEQIDGIQIVPLTPAVVLQIQSLTQLLDIHDRLIVAESLTRGASLLTRDQAITKSGLTPIVW